MAQQAKVRSNIRGALGALWVASLVVLGGCGSGSSGSSDPREGRKSTVGDGLSTSAPEIADSVANAAKDAGCTTQGWPADKGVPAQDSARTHLSASEAQPAYSVSNPPTSGPHDPIWADWGFYDEAIPYRYQIHNLEHGGVVVHYPSTLPKADVEALRALWQEEPAYLIFTPDAPATNPKNGVVVTSWQRWMVCKPFSKGQLGAIRAYRDAYRGAGPENVPADMGLATSSGVSAPGLPRPLARDPKS